MKYVCIYVCICPREHTRGFYGVPLVLYTINISFQCFGLDFDLVIMQFIVFKMVPRRGKCYRRDYIFYRFIDSTPYIDCTVLCIYTLDICTCNKFLLWWAPRPLPLWLENNDSELIYLVKLSIHQEKRFIIIVQTCKELTRRRVIIILKS